MVYIYARKGLGLLHLLNIPASKHANLRLQWWELGRSLHQDNIHQQKPATGNRAIQCQLDKGLHEFIRLLQDNHREKHSVHTADQTLWV